VPQPSAQGRLLLTRISHRTTGLIQLWRGLQPAASRLVSTRLLHCANDSTSRHECRDGSLERLRHEVECALRSPHDEKSGLSAHSSAPARPKEAAALIRCGQGTALPVTTQLVNPGLIG